MEERSGTILYSLVKQKIIQLIHDRKYKAGDQLPTESELCDMFQVSRTTIRLALQQLVLEGRIEKVQGRGTFVSKPKIKQSLSSPLKSFREQMIEQGLIPHSKVLELLVIPATEHLAGVLNVHVNDPINKIVRIRYAENEPLQFETSFIPWNHAPGITIQECEGSLFQLLREKYNINIYRTEENVEPILIDEAISIHLQVPEGAPAFYVETMTYNDQNNPIEFSYATFRGDRSKFLVERIYS